MASVRAEHPKAYEAWAKAKQRCNNPNNPKWVHYGGRGIGMCGRWSASFLAFLADMGDPPAGLTLDRINNDGGYSAENCRWATWFEQNQNQRGSGSTHCLHGHEFTPENTSRRPNGHRICRECARARCAAWRIQRNEKSAA